MCCDMRKENSAIQVVRDAYSCFRPVDHLGYRMAFLLLFSIVLLQSKKE